MRASRPPGIRTNSSDGIRDKVAKKFSYPYYNACFFELTRFLIENNIKKSYLPLLAVFGTWSPLKYLLKMLDL
jgi:hypothetical protein